MTIDDKNLRSLFALSDDIGVLSFYVGITPDLAAEPTPPWPIEIDNRISELRAAVKDDQPHEVWKAVHDRLDGLAGEIADFNDPKAHGRGRAMFVTVSDGRVERFAVQVPFAPRVVFQDGPVVRPLVTAWDEGRPAGILSVDRGGARVLEWTMGEVTELSSETFGTADLEGEKKGPSANNPAYGQEGLTHRERWEDRVDENRKRFHKSVAGDLATQAAERSWDRIIVAGDPRLVHDVQSALPNNGTTVLHVEHPFEKESPAAVADAVWPVLRDARTAREEVLTTRVRDAALSGGAGALGFREVLAALNEKRVAHLLYAQSATASGYRTDDGLLFIEEGGPADAAGYELHPEATLVERAIERAIASDAQVTSISGDAAESMADADGIAALLRW